LQSLELDNDGTICVQALPDTPEYPDATFDGIEFANAGQLNVEEGLLRVNLVGEGSGTAGSSISIGADATLTFGSGYFEQHGTTSGTGQLAIDGDAWVVFSQPCAAGAFTLRETGRVQFAESLSADAITVADETTLSGGEVTAQHEFDWLGASELDSCDITIPEGAKMSIAGSGIKRMRWCGLGIQVGATAYWSGNTNIVVTEDSTITNQGTFTIQCDQSIYADDDVTFEFDNVTGARVVKQVPWMQYQLAMRDQGTGTTMMVRTSFNNQGTVTLQSVGLTLVGDSALGGTFEIGQREYLDLGEGGFDLQGNPIFTGIDGRPAGTVYIGVDTMDPRGHSFDGTLCSVHVNSDTTIPRIDFMQGLIDGAGTLTVTDYFVWQGGDMKGTGATTLTQTASLHFPMLPGTKKDLETRWLNNYGVVSWSGQYFIFRDQAPHDVWPQVFDNSWTGADNLFRYLNAADAAWGTFTSALSQAWSDMISAENAADSAYNAVVDNLDGPYQTALNDFDATYQANLDGAQYDPNYWDEVAQYDGEYDDARTAAMMAPLTAAQPGYVTVEAQAYQNWRAAVNVAEDLYRTAIDNAFRALNSTLRTQGAYAGAGDIQVCAQTLNNLIAAGDANAISDFLCRLSADERAAVATAYARMYFAEVEDVLDAKFRSSPADWNMVMLSLFSGVPFLPATSPDTEQRHDASVQLNSAATNGWGQGVAGFLSNINSVISGWGLGSVVGAVQSIENGAVSSWQYVTGFVRDVSYLAQNDPQTLASAVGEGLLDGAIITADGLTFNAIPSLSLEAQRLVAENGGLYAVSAFSATLSRELLLTSITMGASVAAQGSRAGLVAARLADHPRIVCAVTTASRAYQPIAAFYQVRGTIEAGVAVMDAIYHDDYAGAALYLVDAGLNAMGAAASLRESARLGRAVIRSAASAQVAPLRDYLLNCFAAGTPILGEHGARPIEEYRVGDLVWARDENDPAALPMLKPIEECFVSELPVWHLHVGGQVVRTTEFHPFWIEGRGWTAACDLLPGDRILGRDGETAIVEEVFATCVSETVYNFRVAEYHTYFVGHDGWGFALWAHNSCILTGPAARRGLAKNHDYPTVSNRRGDAIAIWGEAQKTFQDGSETLHAADIIAKARQLALDLPDGSYIVLNRSWRTSVNRYTVSTVGNQNLRPDIIVVRRLRNGKYQISAYERLSPGQTRDDALNGMRQGWLSVVTTGEFKKGLFDTF
jgi:hypothetical protein